MIVKGMQATNQNIISKLQSDILRMQGFKPDDSNRDNSGLGFMKAAFPNGRFPTGCIHEFITANPENASASSGFIAGLLSGLMDNKGATLWISQSRPVHPPALKAFGLEPERFIFIEVKNAKDILWVMEEALKCCNLAAVIGEVKHISFTESRRLQLAVEQSKVTGFIFQKTNNPGTTACVSRWQLSAMPSDSIDDLPGVGYPKWNVELLRMRNGKAGQWNIVWKEGRFIPEHQQLVEQVLRQKAG